jgi:transposase
VYAFIIAYIDDHARDQMLLLPAVVDDYVAADNPVRFIEAFVDELDLKETGFLRSRPKTTGRPGMIRAICSSFTCTAI